MLQNAYLLAKICADTAENERNFAEKFPKFGNFSVSAVNCQGKGKWCSWILRMPPAAARPGTLFADLGEYVDRLDLALARLRNERNYVYPKSKLGQMLS